MSTCPPFALDRLRQRGAELVCHCPEPQSGGKQVDLVLTPLELIERIAALVPPPRTHRHRYYGVLAPNSPLRAVVTAMAQAVPAQIAVGQRDTAEDGTSEGALGPAQPGNALGDAGMAEPAVRVPQPEPTRRFPAHYLWAVLIARIYAVFPLVWPRCGGNMRLIAFITEGCRSGGSWSTSMWTPRLRVSPRHASRRCGTSVMRGARTQLVSGRVPGSNRTGVKQPRQRPMTHSINAPIGERANRPAMHTRRGPPCVGRAPGRRKRPGKRSMRTR